MTIYSFDVILSNLEQVHCSMSSSSCCFLTCIQVSQETGKVVWYTYIFNNFSQFAVIHTVKGFSIVNEAEVVVFLEFPCFSFLFIYLFYFTILYWFCHTSSWICHGCTHVPNSEPLSHLPPHTIPLGHPSPPAPSFLYPASNLDWRFISYMIIYMF